MLHFLQQRQQHSTRREPLLPKPAVRNFITPKYSLFLSYLDSCSKKGNPTLEISAVPLSPLGADISLRHSSATQPCLHSILSPSTRPLSSHSSLQYIPTLSMQPSAPLLKLKQGTYQHHVCPLCGFPKQ